MYRTQKNRKIKICKRCGIKLDEKNWYSSSQKDRSYFCKLCILKRNSSWRGENIEYDNQWRKEHPERKWAGLCLNKHKQKGYEINISINELEKLGKNTKVCPICDADLDWSYGTKGRGPKSNSPTLDRKNNENFLNEDNIWIVCHRCNRVKNSLTIVEMVNWCRVFLKKYG